MKTHKRELIQETTLNKMKLILREKIAEGEFLDTYQDTILMEIKLSPINQEEQENFYQASIIFDRILSRKNSNQIPTKKIKEHGLSMLNFS